MICWRCGKSMESADETCPNCGAEKPKTRRRQVSNETIRRYDMTAERAEEVAEPGIVSPRRPRRQSAPPEMVTSDTIAIPVKRRPSERPSQETITMQRVPKAGSADTRKTGERPRPIARERNPRENVNRAREARIRDNRDTLKKVPKKTAAPPPTEVVDLPVQHKMPHEEETPLRMVRRYEYEAILPEMQDYDHVHWLRLCLIAILSVVVLVTAIYFFLSKSDLGQRWLASIGREATVEAYHEVGRTYMVDGSISKAIWALEIAEAKDPENLEILIDLGKAYMGNNERENAEIAYSRAIEKWPAYPEPYRLMTNNLLEQGRNFEALRLIEIALEATGDDSFSTLYNRLIPSIPAVSKLGDRFEKEFVLELSTSEENTEIFYTLDGSDPILEGVPYDEEKKIPLTENNWHLRAVCKRDGMYSEEQTQYYYINKPNPDMPKSSLASGTYSSVKTVTLRPGGATEVDIYYTMDGTSPADKDGPSPNAKLFEEPIQLRVGKTQLRAIAFSKEDGKRSNEMKVEYKCEGATKASMTEKDTIDKLKLFSTTQSAFESTYGAPQSLLDDGEDLLGTYTKAIYPFGYAVFLTRGSKDPVLVELSTSSSSFAAPRGTKVGSRMEDVVDAFRDEGGEENLQGNRVLYTLTVGRIGMLNKISETEYTVSYYCKLESNGHYIELTYHVSNGLVDRIDWIQYDPA